eukprot:Rhum_TRINITY_DN14082_c29_g1::Rhum_TRINITY_DN14082_c29_g1_i1::g.67209::m.67209
MGTTVTTAETVCISGDERGEKGVGHCVRGEKGGGEGWQAWRRQGLDASRLLSRRAHLRVLLLLSRPRLHNREHDEADGAQAGDGAEGDGHDLLRVQLVVRGGVRRAEHDARRAGGGDGRCRRGADAGAALQCRRGDARQGAAHAVLVFARGGGQGRRALRRGADRGGRGRCGPERRVLCVHEDVGRAGGGGGVVLGDDVGEHGGGGAGVEVGQRVGAREGHVESAQEGDGCDRGAEGLNGGVRHGERVLHKQADRGELGSGGRAGQRGTGRELQVVAELDRCVRRAGGEARGEVGAGVSEAGAALAPVAESRVQVAGGGGVSGEPAVGVLRAPVLHEGRHGTHLAPAEHGGRGARVRRVVAGGQSAVPRAVTRGDARRGGGVRRGAGTSARARGLLEAVVAPHSQALTRGAQRVNGGLGGNGAAGAGSRRVGHAQFGDAAAADHVLEGGGQGGVSGHDGLDAGGGHGAGRRHLGHVHVEDQHNLDAAVNAEVRAVRDVALGRLREDLDQRLRVRRRQRTQPRAGARRAARGGVEAGGVDQLLRVGEAPPVEGDLGEVRTAGAAAAVRGTGGGGVAHLLAVGVLRAPLEGVAQRAALLQRRDGRRVAAELGVARSGPARERRLRDAAARHVLGSRLVLRRRRARKALARRVAALGAALAGAGVEVARDGGVGGLLLVGARGTHDWCGVDAGLRTAGFSGGGVQKRSEAENGKGC